MNSSFCNDHTDDPILGNMGLRVLLLVYMFGLALVGTVGNIIVAIATLNPVNFDIDKATLLLIRHLAVADFLYTLTTHCSILLSGLGGNHWILGPQLCYIFATFRWIPGTAGHLIILTISIHRTWTIQNPLQPAVRCRVIVGVTALIWIISLTPSLSAVGVGATACFDDVIKTCASTFYTMIEYKTLLSLLSFLFLLLPMLLVLGLNGLLLVISLRHKLSYRGLRTVIFVCGLFILTIMPYNIAVIIRALNGHVNVAFELFYGYVYPLNSALNPILYTYTNRQFREMLVTVCRKHVFPKQSTSF